MELPEILPLPKTNSLVNRFRFFNSKITYAFFLKDHIHSLNSFLKYLRAHDIVSSVFWKVPGVQYLIDDICFEMWVPTVRLHSREIFLEEYFDAAMRSGIFSPRDILSRLQMISLIFSRIEAMSLEYQSDDFIS